VPIHRLPWAFPGGDPRGKLVREDGDEILRQVNLYLVKSGNDLGPNVGIDQAFGEGETFPEDIEFAVTSNEPDDRDDTVWMRVNLWQGEPRRRKDGGVPLHLNNLQGSFPFEAAVTVVAVVKKGEVAGLGFEVLIIPEPLSPEEFSLVGVIEVLHSAIAPGFSERDEDNLDPEGETEFQDNPERARIAVASTKTELVVDLEKVGHSHGSPASQQARGHCLVVLGPLRMSIDPMAVKVQEIERVKAAVVFDVAWAHQVGLVDVVDSERLDEIRVLSPFGDVSRFF
jgi:hypothetical protein